MQAREARGAALSPESPTLAMVRDMSTDRMQAREARGAALSPESPTLAMVRDMSTDMAEWRQLTENQGRCFPASLVHFGGERQMIGRQ